MSAAPSSGASSAATFGAPRIAATVLTELNAASLDVSDLCVAARLGTDADGAAIALRNGEEFVCRASTGMAPEIGVPLELNRGVCAECVRTAALVLRHELPGAVPSVVAVPVMWKGQTEGVVAVFSQRAHAFRMEHVDAVRAIALAVAGCFAARANLQPAVIPPTRSSDEVREAEPIAKTAPELSGVELNKADEDPLEIEAAVATLAERCAELNIEFGGIADKGEERAAIDAQRLSFANVNASTETNRRPLLITAVALAIAVSLSVAWTALHRSDSGSLKPSPTAVIARTPNAAAISNPAEAVAEVQQPVASAPAVRKRALAPEPEFAVSGGRRVVASLPDVAEAPAPAVAFSNPDASTLTEIVATAAPTLPAAARATAPAATAPTKATTVASAPALPKLLTKVAPELPPSLVRKGVNGTVVLEIKIRPNGHVSSVSAKRGDAQLVGPTMTAVRQWRYEPLPAGAPQITRELVLTVNVHATK